MYGAYQPQQAPPPVDWGMIIQLASALAPALTQIQQGQMVAQEGNGRDTGFFNGLYDGMVINPMQRAEQSIVKQPTPQDQAQQQAAALQFQMMLRQLYQHTNAVTQQMEQQRFPGLWQQIRALPENRVYPPSGGLSETRDTDKDHQAKRSWTGSYTERNRAWNRDLHNRLNFPGYPTHAEPYPDPYGTRFHGYNEERDPFRSTNYEYQKSNQAKEEKKKKGKKK